MTVKRIVANVAAANPAAGSVFYGEVLGLKTLMDPGWIMTLGVDERATVQFSLASPGGSDTEVPDLSIEVDDVDAVHAAMQGAGFNAVYGPVDEPWGVRRFYVRDPFGKLVNVLAHTT